MLKVKRMITIEDDDYLKLSLLLLKGGGMISEEILNREVMKSGDSIDKSLGNFGEKKLKHQFHEKQMQVLFPTSRTTNIKDWDIQMVTGVLLTVFKKGLDKQEKEAIGDIKFVRNEIYAHRSLEPLTHSKYEKVRKELVAALELLSSKLDKPIQLKCKEVIKVCTESRLDKPTVDKLLEGISETEKLSNKILNRLDQMSNELRQKMEEEHEKTRKVIVDELQKILMDKERSNQKIKTELDTELTLTGDKGQPEVLDAAENIIVTDINRAVDDNAESIENLQIMPAIKDVIGHINSIPGVEVLHAKPKCIILTFRCTSYEGLLNLLLFFESEAFRNSLSKIVDAVCAIMPLKKPASLSSRLNPESLKRILNSIAFPVESETLYKRTVKLPIKVTSVGGMAEVYNLFENGGATNSFNKVSESISFHLGAKITLKPSLNVKQVEKELISAHEKCNEDLQDTGETEIHYHSENKEEFQEKENEDTNELSTSVIVEKMADSVPSNATGCEDFDSRKTLPSSRSPDTYEEEETDETYATQRKKMEKDKEGLENIEEIGVPEKHDHDQDILFLSSDQEMADINVLYSSLLLQKSREYEPSIDSGFDDDASSKAWSSSRQSVASEEEKKYENEISIGMSFRMETQTRGSMSSVGPFVSIEGMHSKCFITFGFPEKAVYTINSRQRHLKVLAYSSKTHDMLVALDEAESSRGKDGDLGSELLIQADTGFLTDGTKVFKVGVSGYTEGVISNKILIDIDLFIMVESLPGSQKSFANPGDAGSAVFCKIEDKVCCIGIVVGVIVPKGNIAVRNINNVLTDLQNVYGKQISLDKCEMNSQLSKIPEVKEFSDF